MATECQKRVRVAETAAANQKIAECSAPEIKPLAIRFREQSTTAVMPHSRPFYACEAIAWPANL